MKGILLFTIVLLCPAGLVFAQQPGDVTPILDCVYANTAKNEVSAFFGYVNNTPSSVTVPVGPNNSLSPSPKNWGQTTTFSPGAVHRVWVATFDLSQTSSITWTLLGINVTASNDPTLYCSFPVGLPGAAGPEGATGPQGPQGSTGTTGTPGPAGATGPAGSQGGDGAAGSSGLPGPTGLTGANGIQGPTGADGFPGATGPSGPVGPGGGNGPAGAVGPTGVIGAAGPQGASPAGDSGAQGAAGATGSTGARGSAGPPGPAGAQGPAGKPGGKGPIGPAGPTGPQGPAAATPSIRVAAIDSPIGGAIAFCNLGEVLVGGGGACANSGKSTPVSSSLPVGITWVVSCRNASQDQASAVAVCMRVPIP
jgi:hypothetical protein